MGRHDCAFAYGFPYREAPKTYVRKLTLAPSGEAFSCFGKGASITLTWELAEIDAVIFLSACSALGSIVTTRTVRQPVDTPYTVDRMKEVLSNFFVESYVDNTPTHYYSGVELKRLLAIMWMLLKSDLWDVALLNAFNALEYGALQNRQELMNSANSVFDTYLQNGFSPAGFSMRWYIIIVALKNPSTVSAANQRVCMPC